MSYKIKISNELLRKIHQYQIDILENIDNEIEVKANKKKLKRIYFLLQNKNGIANKEIASKLNMSVDSISKWAKCFCEEEIDTFLSINLTGGKKSELDNYGKEIRKFAFSNKFRHVTIYELQQFLLEEYSIPKSYSWLTRYCKRNNIPVKNRRQYNKYEFNGELFEFERSSYRVFIFTIEKLITKNILLSEKEINKIRLTRKGNADSPYWLKRSVANEAIINVESKKNSRERDSFMKKYGRKYKN